MRRESVLLLAVFLTALILSAGCKRGADAPGLTKLGPSSAATTTILPVGSPHCPGGGVGIYAGSDTNANGVLDASEVLKGVPVCDPLSDAGRPAGLATLVMIASEPTGTLHCAAGGLKVLSGPDANRNGMLDADEVAFTEYLCNGTPGSSSAAGITVALGPWTGPAQPGGETKVGKPAPAKSPAAAAGKAPGAASGKAASPPAAKAKRAPAAPAAPVKKESTEAGPPPEGKDVPAEPAAPPKKAREAASPAAPGREKGAAAPPAVPPGWTGVKGGNAQLASVAYKLEGRYIIVRFTNLSATSMVRCKYTVRWKENRNGNLVDDSTMEGISFRLRPQESLDREVRTQSPEVQDVVIDLDVAEAN
jgi:hypothetical protein